MTSFLMHIVLFTILNFCISVHYTISMEKTLPQSPPSLSDIIISHFAQRAFQEKFLALYNIGFQMPHHKTKKMIPFPHLPQDLGKKITDILATHPDVCSWIIVKLIALEKLCAAPFKGHPDAYHASIIKTCFANISSAWRTCLEDQYACTHWSELYTYTQVMPSAIDFSPNSTRFAFSTKRRGIFIENSTEKKDDAHISGVNASFLAFHPTENILISKCTLEVPYYIDLSHKDYKKTLVSKQNTALAHIILSPDKQHLLLQQGRASYHIIPTKGNLVYISALQSISNPFLPSTYTALALSNDGKYIAHDNNNPGNVPSYTITIVSPTQSPLYSTLIGHTNTVTDLAFSSVGNTTLFSVSADFSLRKWDLKTNKCIKTHIFDAPLITLALATHAPLLACGSTQKTYIFNHVSWHVLATLNQGPTLRATPSSKTLAISPDGNHVGIADMLNVTVYTQTPWQDHLIKKIIERKGNNTQKKQLASSYLLKKHASKKFEHETDTRELARLRNHVGLKKWWS